MDKFYGFLVEAEMRLDSQRIKEVNDKIEKQRHVRITEDPEKAAANLKLSAQQVCSIFSKRFWDSEKEESLAAIRDYVRLGKTSPNYYVFGFFPLWLEGEIDHPILNDLARHIYKNDLIKYPYVQQDWLDYVEVKTKTKQGRTPTKPIDCLDSIMAYIQEGSTIKGSDLLNANRTTFVKHLRVLAELYSPAENYEIFLRSDFKYRSTLLELLNLWNKQRKKID